RLVSSLFTSWPASSVLVPYTTLFRSTGAHGRMLHSLGHSGCVGDLHSTPFPSFSSHSGGLFVWSGVQVKSLVFAERTGSPGKSRSEEHRLNSSHVKISYAVFSLKKKL